MEQQRVETLIDIGRLLSRRREFVRVDCPACGAKDADPKFEKNGINYVDCATCRTFYVNPRPTADLLEWFYRGSPNYAYWNKVVFPATESARLEKIFVPRVDRVLDVCRKHGIGQDALLEIGAGFGTFCSEVKRRGAFSRVVALELTPDLAKTCRERGLEVLEQPVEKIEAGEGAQFDVVASYEVIEHLFAPADFIAQAVRLIRPGGVLILTCPNGQGFDVETLGSVSNTVDHEHLNYFNPESLSGLLRRNGLEILESQTPGRLDADLVRNKILSGSFDVSRQPFLRKVLIEEWDSFGQPFQDFLVRGGLSSNLLIVARKPDSAS